MRPFLDSIHGMGLTNHIWKIEDSGLLMNVLSSGFRNIGIDAAGNLDRFSSDFTFMLLNVLAPIPINEKRISAEIRN